jgi:hypothetical protein
MQLRFSAPQGDGLVLRLRVGGRTVLPIAGRPGSRLDEEPNRVPLPVGVDAVIRATRIITKRSLLL